MLNDVQLGGDLPDWPSSGLRVNTFDDLKHGHAYFKGTPGKDQAGFLPEEHGKVQGHLGNSVEQSIEAIHKAWIRVAQEDLLQLYILRGVIYQSQCGTYIILEKKGRHGPLLMTKRSR